MNELSFLLDLLLNHKLPRSARELVLARVKEVEAKVSSFIPHEASRPHASVQQAPSTLAALAKHELPVPQIQMPPIPEQIGQTPAAAQALASRNAAINEALSGKIPKGQERPRKW